MNIKSYKEEEIVEENSQAVGKDATERFIKAKVGQGIGVAGKSLIFMGGTILSIVVFDITVSYLGMGIYSCMFLVALIGIIVALIGNYIGTGKLFGNCAEEIKDVLTPQGA